MPRFRSLDVGSYDEAVDELQPGEHLVVSGPNNGGSPLNGRIPVTSDRSFRISTEKGNPPGVPYAESND